MKSETLGVMALAAAAALAVTAARGAEPPSPGPPGGEARVRQIGAECELVFPAGAPFLLDSGKGTGLTLAVHGVSFAAGQEGAGECGGTIQTGSIGAGEGHTLTLRVPPGSLRSIERAAESVTLVWEPQFREEDTGGIGEDTYLIGVDDKLKISLASPEKLDREVTVDRDGRIAFDYIGTFTVAGLTPEQAAERLERLLDEGYLVSPELSVTVSEYASKFFYVTGEVDKPGRFPLRAGTSLKDALASAGGFTENAGHEINLTRAASEGSAEQRIVLKRSEFEREGGGLHLRAGDVVDVAGKPYFSILGEVAAPQQVRHEPGMTLLRAIAIAGGLKEWANRKEIVINRTVDGKLVGETYDYRAIEKRKAPDVPIQPGDFIIIKRRLL